MEELFTRLWDDLTGRIGGPMSFRLLLQPMMALIFAIREGLKDAREGRPAYFYSLFSSATCVRRPGRRNYSEAKRRGTSAWR